MLCCLQYVDVPIQLRMGVTLHDELISNILELHGDGLRTRMAAAPGVVRKRAPECRDPLRLLNQVAGCVGFVYLVFASWVVPRVGELVLEM